MKKFLLLGAVAMMTMAVSAQTITPVWEVAVPEGQGARCAVGVKGKVYLPNNATGMVEEWENGAATGKSWDVNAFMVSTGLTYEVTNADTGVTEAKSHTMWSYAKADDAGNILVSANDFGNKYCNFWVVIPADGSDMKLLNIEEFPAGVKTNRVDAAFDVVGDLMSDAYIFLGPAGSSNVACINVFPAEDGSGLTALLETSAVIPSATALSTGADLVSTSTYEELTEGAGTAAGMGAGLYMRIRNANPILKWDGAGLSEYKVNEVGVGANGLALGFDIFKIGEVEYYVVPTADKAGGSANGRTTAFDIRNLADGSVVATYTTGAATDSANNSYQAEVSEDGKTATIYAYSQLDKLGVYTFDPQGNSAIESIAADANAPVEYYNLQGVKVAKAENGLFIKKQGNKAVKVVL